MLIQAVLTHHVSLNAPFPGLHRGTKMNFSIIAIATSIASFLLAIGWLFAGGLVLK
jgi:hypothetical protein